MKKTTPYTSFKTPIPHSRVHALRSFSSSNIKSFLKRDDELSFGVSGCKWRKYQSLLPWLIKQGYQQVILTGSPYSNHILSFTQLLIENQMTPILFLVGEPEAELVGNFLLSSLLVEPKNIHWIPRQDKDKVPEIVSHYCANHKNKKIAFTPEGAFMPQALPGALTLPLDILANEASLGFSFDHIFIEAGTGLMAIALILAYASLKKQTRIHVVMLADSPEIFHHKLHQMHATWEGFEGPPPNLSSAFFTLHTPTSAKSFGSVNQETLRTILHTARQEGVLLDPLYGAKLFTQVPRIIEQQSLQGSILLIHGGGALSLLGYQEKLRQLLEVNL